MKTIVVLAMQGVPARDFPHEELVEFAELRDRLEHSRESLPEQAVSRHDELESKIRSWPRNQKNDPFAPASTELATKLSSAIGLEVIIGFNEFCSPSLVEAFDSAVEKGAARVVVVTPVMTRGGDHAEVDIPAVIREAQKKHPSVEFSYVWPFPASRVAKFLATQMRAHL